MNLNPNRPNTGVDDVFLQKDVILCCGEDTNDLLDAIKDVTGSLPLIYHEYRCFRFWKFPAFTLIWSGMGTGCLEPLLFEILGTDIVQRIVLVGTAGATSKETMHMGYAYFIRQAYLGTTGVHSTNRTDPILPNFSLSQSRQKLQSATIVSTDYYFGFSQNTDARIVRLQNADEDLTESLRLLWKTTDLVDMETAQFFWFCKLLGSATLQYAAIKGPANDVSGPSTAILDVIASSIREAFLILDLPKSPSARSVNPQQVHTTSEESSGKLMEEIKLYWTIQVAVGGILGYLGTNLTFAATDAGKNIYLCGVSFLLITIGGIYNLVGNYYSRIEGIRAGRSSSQENLVTPTVALAYLLVSGMVGAILTHSIYTILGPILSSDHDMLKGMSLGVLLNWFVCRRVFIELYDSAPPNYRDYSRKLRLLYLYKFTAWKKRRVR